MTSLNHNTKLLSYVKPARLGNVYPNKTMEDNFNQSFQCFYGNCNKEYLSKYSLKRHINSKHLKIKPHVCEICSKAFIANQLLKEHMLVHTGEKPKQCPICYKHFRHASQLSSHKKMHSTDEIDRIAAGNLRLTILISRFGGLPKEEIEDLNPNNEMIELPMIKFAHKRPESTTDISG
jgi:hypothetical protein